MNIESLDESIYNGLLYAETKANERRNAVLGGMRVEELDNPMTAQTVEVAMDRIEFERRSDRQFFEELT